MFLFSSPTFPKFKHMHAVVGNASFQIWITDPSNNVASVGQLFVGYQWFRQGGILYITGMKFSMNDEGTMLTWWLYMSMKSPREGRGLAYTDHGVTEGDSDLGSYCLSRAKWRPLFHPSNQISAKLLPRRWGAGCPTLPLRSRGSSELKSASFTTNGSTSSEEK